MSKNHLDTETAKQRTSGRDELACANRRGLEHDRATDGVWTRLDLTMGVWKFFGGVFAARKRERPRRGSLGYDGAK
jgi:hypothetical protein